MLAQVTQPFMPPAGVMRLLTSYAPLLRSVVIGPDWARIRLVLPSMAGWTADGIGSNFYGLRSPFCYCRSATVQLTSYAFGVRRA